MALLAQTSLPRETPLRKTGVPAPSMICVPWARRKAAPGGGGVGAGDAPPQTEGGEEGEEGEVAGHDVVLPIEGANVSGGGGA